MKSNKSNMVIKHFISPSNNNNAYLLINGDEAAVIDPADAYQDIKDALDKMGIGLKYLLITHGHKSHFDSAPMLKKDFGGKFCLHKLDVDLLRESGYNLEPDLTVKDSAYTRTHRGFTLFLCEKHQRVIQRRYSLERRIRKDMGAS